MSYIKQKKSLSRLGRQQRGNGKNEIMRLSASHSTTKNVEPSSQQKRRQAKPQVETTRIAFTCCPGCCDMATDDLKGDSIRTIRRSSRQLDIFLPEREAIKALRSYGFKPESERDEGSFVIVGGAA